MATRILLVDALRIVREGLRRILEAQEGYEVVGEAADGDEALRRVSETRPDVAVLEPLLPGRSGVSLIEETRRRSAETACIVLSARVGRVCVQEAMRAGASAYLPKDCSGGELRRAIEAVRQGQCFLSPSVARFAFDHRNGGGEEGGVAQLSRREREVLELIAEGLSSKEIAARLGVSPKTADSHRAGLMHKLGIHKSAGLVRLAIREGLVAP